MPTPLIEHKNSLSETPDEGNGHAADSEARSPVTQKKIPGFPGEPSSPGSKTFGSGSWQQTVEEFLAGALCDSICRVGGCCSARSKTGRMVPLGEVDFPNANAAPRDAVWYFTFGGNMNVNTLKRRGIGHVHESVVGSLPGYQLAFTYEGYDGCEPRFANIEEMPPGGGGVAVQGVAHRLSRAQLAKLDVFEGAGAAYERISVEFVAAEAGSSKEEEEAGFKINRAAPRRFVVQAYRALPSHTVAPGLPSKRYVKLLADGAESHGLEPDYVAALRSLETYNCSGTAMPAWLVEAMSLDELRSVSLDELQQHAYSPENATAGAKAKPVWVAMGGLVFDVSAKVSGRAMLRSMSGGDGTAFVRRMWLAAFGEGPGAGLGGTWTPKAGQVVRVAELPPEQREYVASWANHLAAHYRCVGVLREAFAAGDAEEG